MHKLLGLFLVFAGLSCSMSNTIEAEEKSQLGMAMVALAEHRIPSGDEILRYLKAKWPDARDFGKVEVDNGVISFTGSDGEMAFLSLMPVPLPAEEIEYPCKTAIHWPQACDEFAKSRAHVIVAVMPKRNDPVDTLMRATMLTQAVSELAGGLGIYWGAGELVEKPDIFAEMAREMSRDEPPVGLWVGIKFEKEKDGSFSFATRGLEQFDLANIEIQKERVDPNFAYAFIGDVAAYLVNNGPVIKEGDTVGETNEQRITVRMAPSIVDPGKQIYRLDF